MLLAVLADSPLLENLALGKAHREVAIISNYSLSVNEIVEKEKSFKKKCIKKNKFIYTSNLL